MLKIVESGLMHIWKQNWWPKRNFCSGPVKAVATRIELIDVQSAFYILFIGGVLGSIVVFAENIRKKYLDSKWTMNDTSNVRHISSSTFPVQVTDQTLWWTPMLMSLYTGVNVRQSTTDRPVVTQKRTTIWKEFSPLLVSDNNENYPPNWRAHLWRSCHFALRTLCIINLDQNDIVNNNCKTII